MYDSGGDPVSGGRFFAAVWAVKAMFRAARLSPEAGPMDAVYRQTGEPLGYG